MSDPAVTVAGDGTPAFEVRLEARYFHDADGRRCASRWWRQRRVLELSTLASPAWQARALQQTMRELLTTSRAAAGRR